MNSITVRHLRDSAALMPVGITERPKSSHRRSFELPRAREVRPLFSREIGLQSRKFSEMLAWVIAHLEQPDELATELRKLGARHGGYGVEINHYAPVGSALIWMFQQTLGDRFTPEMEEAWLEAYAFISGEMERGFSEKRPLKGSSCKRTPHIPLIPIIGRHPGHLGPMWLSRSGFGGLPSSR